MTDPLLMSAYDYELPPALIAQTAAEPRDAARLLVLNRANQSLTHEPHFRAIINYLQPGDSLVVNESKVIPARLYGRKLASGGQIELLILRPAPEELVQAKAEIRTWESLVRPGRGTNPGAKLLFGKPGDELAAEVIGESPAGGRYIRFEQPPLAFLERQGEMPLPPYIHTKPTDPSRYQTVYANPQASGSAAAPTAGLHFTADLLTEIQQRGVSLERVQLHVGLDTFQPVKTDSALEHHMHSEWCTVAPAVAARLNATRAAGGRIVVVGTTAVRSLETAFNPASGQIEPYAGDTSIFLYPGKKLQATDALITNFHLPRSSLLLLVSAFAGRDFILQAYQEAIRQRYRFFSFGDAMFIC